MQTTDSPVALALAGLERSYGRRRVLHSVSASIPAGGVAALVGVNGAGKTTLLHTIVGLARPDAGRVLVFGKTPRAALAEGDLAFVAQDKPVYRTMSVQDHLRLGAHLNRRWDMPFAVARLASLDIGLDRRAGTLSGGQQSQLALTLALAKRPRLLVLDEPAAALDPLARHEFLTAVAAEAREHTITVLHSSHAVADLEDGSDYLMILRDGALVCSGATSELLEPGRSLEHFVLATLRGAGAGTDLDGKEENR
jgi:ABC-2 type transport system ATP-binding protein